MPTATYTALANITLATAASTISFSSIPATYRDLLFIFSGTGSTTLQGRIRINGDTGSNYLFQRMSGSGASASAARISTGATSGTISTIAQATTTGALQMNINIMDYSATDKHKTMLQRSTSAVNISAQALRWASTSAITSLVLVVTTQSIGAGTTLSLYGIVS